MPKDLPDLKGQVVTARGFGLARVTIKADENGERQAEAVIVGTSVDAARDLVDSLGQAVELRAGDRRALAVLLRIGFKAGKDGKAGSSSLKVRGAPDLDEMMGRPLIVLATQLPLPVKA